MIVCGGLDCDAHLRGDFTQGLILEDGWTVVGHPRPLAFCPAHLVDAARVTAVTRLTPTRDGAA